MYQVGTCMVHCPFPCNVLVMYRLGTLVLAPSVSQLPGIGTDEPYRDTHLEL